MNQKDVINIETMDEFNTLLNSLNLSDRQRQIFILRYSRKMAIVDIAEELEISKATVCEDSKVIRQKLAAIERESFKRRNNIDE